MALIRQIFGKEKKQFARFLKHVPAARQSIKNLLNFSTFTSNL